MLPKLPTMLAKSNKIGSLTYESREMNCHQINIPSSYMDWPIQLRT